MARLAPPERPATAPPPAKSTLGTPGPSPSLQLSSSSPSSPRAPQQPRRNRKKQAMQSSPRPIPDPDASTDSDSVEPQPLSSPSRPAAPTKKGSGRRTCRRASVTPSKTSSPATVVGSHSDDDSLEQRTRQSSCIPDVAGRGPASCGLAPARALTPTLMIQNVPAQQNQSRHARCRSAISLLTNAQHTEWDMPTSQPQPQPLSNLTWQQQQAAPLEPSIASKDKRPPRRRSKSLRGIEKVQNGHRNKESGHSHVTPIRINTVSSMYVTPQSGQKYSQSLLHQTPNRPIAHGLVKNDDGHRSAMTWQQSLIQSNGSTKLSVADLFGPLEAEPRKKPQLPSISPTKRSGKKGITGSKAHTDDPKWTPQTSPIHIFASTPPHQTSQLQSSPGLSPPYSPLCPTIMSGARYTASSPLKSQTSPMNSGAYAGPDFHNSPSAGDLPIPKFMLRGQPSPMDGFNRSPIAVSQ